MKLLSILLALAATPIAAGAADIVQDADVIPEYEFEDVTLDAANAISCRTIWEKDLTADSKYDGVPNDNNHGLFIIGDILYVYNEVYPSAGFRLYRYNLTTGEDLSTLNGDFPGSGRGMPLKYISPDEANHIVCAFYDQDNNTSSTAVWHFDIYDAELKLIKKDVTYTAPYKYINRQNRNLYFLGYSSVRMSISGDVTSDSWSICYDGWAAEINDSSTMLPTGYPRHTVIEFTADATEYPKYTFRMFDNGVQPPFNQAELTTQSACLLSANAIDDEYSLAQTRNEDNAPGALALFKRTNANAAFGEADHFTLAETLPEDSPFATSDPYIQGAFPFKVGDNTVIAIPSKFNSSDGFKCLFAAMPSGTPSLASLQKLWEYPTSNFPKNSDKFPAAASIYYRERPFVIAQPEEISAEKTASTNSNYYKTTYVATYMPGVYLAVHKLRSEIAGIPSGLTTTSLQQEPIITLYGNEAEIRCDRPTPVTIHTVSGSLLYSATATGRLTIDLSRFHSTPCILRAGSATAKILP